MQGDQAGRYCRDARVLGRVARDAIICAEKEAIGRDLLALEGGECGRAHKGEGDKADDLLGECSSSKGGGDGVCGVGVREAAGEGELERVASTCSR
eukprot:1022776-Prymnesium_polylepis.3